MLEYQIYNNIYHDGTFVIFSNYNEFAKALREIFQLAKQNGKNAEFMCNSALEQKLAVYFNKLLENQEKWRAVNYITTQINSTIDLNTLYQTVIEQLLTILDIDYCAICVFDEKAAKFVLKTIENESQKKAYEYLFEFVEHCNAIYRNSILTTMEKQELFCTNIENNYSGVPLINKEKFLGALFVYNEERLVSDESLQILRLVTDNVACALMNAKLYESVRNSDREKLEFIGGMAHELKNPLSNIIGFVDLLTEGAINDAEKREKYLENINSESGILTSLVNDILDMARAECGKLELSCREFNPKEVILESIALKERNLNEKNLDLQFELCQGKIWGDPTRFRQVIINLLNNSIKYTFENGNIHIKTKCDDENFYFEISDDGEGISPENQRKLFKFFSQANGVKGKRKEGYGLGLALCKMFINMHKGEICVKSEQDKGSVFTFRIPSKETVDEESLTV